MLKKILIGIVILIAVKIIGLIAADAGYSRGKEIYSSSMSQEDYDKAVSSARDLSPEDQAKILENQSNKPFKISQDDLSRLVASLNKGYPKTMPDGSRIDKAVVGERSITYHRTLLEVDIKDVDMSDADSADARKEHLILNCKNAGIKNLLNSGVTISNLYNDMNGTYILTRQIQPEDCDSINK